DRPNGGDELDNSDHLGERDRHFRPRAHLDLFCFRVELARDDLDLRLIKERLDRALLHATNKPHSEVLHRHADRHLFADDGRELRPLADKALSDAGPRFGNVEADYVWRVDHHSAESARATALKPSSFAAGWNPMRGGASFQCPPGA